MMSRELSRRQARRKRAAARAMAAQRAHATTEILGAALTKAREIIDSDTAFVQMLYTHGVHSIPRGLSPRIGTRSVASNSPDDNSLDCSLEFVIAWTFLFPLFKHAEIEAYLETEWPGFILQMKDAFIAVVVEGPLRGAR